MDYADKGMRLAVAYGDGQWADLGGEQIEGGRFERAVFLPFGTRLGNPTVELLVRTRSGLLVHANTTWALWSQATDLFERWAAR